MLLSYHEGMIVIAHSTIPLSIHSASNDIDMNDNRVAMDHDGQYIAIDTTSFVNNNSIDDNGWMDGVDNSTNHYKWRNGREGKGEREGKDMK